MKLFCLLFFFLNILMASQFDNLIPLPNNIKTKKGYFILNFKTKIVVFSLKKKDVDFVVKEIREKTGLSLEIEIIDTKWGTSNKRIYPNDIVIRPSIPSKKQIKGSYKLLIDEEITISAGDKEGILNAFATLRQLVYFGFDEKNKEVKIQKGSIIDSPKFSWRGMHLDVSRHFYNVDEIKKYLDYLSFYKYNIFHWHLIDDGGWRLEIKKYPKLTKLGGFRFGKREGYNKRTLSFPKTEKELKSKETYGGYYTQEDVREIVNYAKKRGIDIIPEIELPGHNLPALAVYPELRCVTRDDNGNEIFLEGSRQNSFCAGNEKSFEFLENVLEELIELFPFEYIHIGADEVMRDFWRQCPLCQKRMLEENIISQDQFDEYKNRPKGFLPTTVMIRTSKAFGDKNLENLQTYFVKRIIKFIHSKSKKVAAWDDGVTHWDKIEDSPLQKGDMIFYWRGNRNLEKAIENGIKVARMHMGSVYFDYNKDTYPPYNYDIIPKNLGDNPYATNILGSQGCVWTEWMNDFDRVEYMVFPRIASLAENLWTKNKNYDSFSKRIYSHYPIWLSKKIDFKLPSPSLKYNLIITGNESAFDYEIENTFYRNKEITFQYSKKNITREINTKSILLGNIFPFNNFKKKVNIDFFYSTKYASTMGEKSILSIIPKDLIVLNSLKQKTKGIKVYHKEMKTRKVPNFNSLKNLVSENSDRIKIIDQYKGRNNFVLFYRFYIEVKESGSYDFFLGSDDGSILKLGRTKIIDNDGPHGFSYRSGKCYLVKGYYPIEIGFFELGASEKIDFFVEKDGEKVDLEYYQRD